MCANKVSKNICEEVIVLLITRTAVTGAKSKLPTTVNLCRYDRCREAERSHVPLIRPMKKTQTPDVWKSKRDTGGAILWLEVSPVYVVPRNYRSFNGSPRPRVYGKCLSEACTLSRRRYHDPDLTRYRRRIVG